MSLFHYSFMLPALVACLILAGIHTYFGYHVVQRGVIFVDLALSQIAALGASIALILGWGENSPVLSFTVSLFFTFGGALLFSFIRKIQNTAPMEAVIGITYAGAISISLLVLEKSATGTEHIKEMLAGTILTVSWTNVLQIGILLFSIGVIHYIFRKKFFIISELPKEAEKNGLKIWWWDIVFYSTFGLAVTMSVKVAGVLLVFALLIIPAVSAIICMKGTYRRVIFGWFFGTIGCISGLEFSLRADCSAGPSIITALIALLLLSSAISIFIKQCDCVK